jgi:DNA-binding transcriptional MerR regulator
LTFPLGERFTLQSDEEGAVDARLKIGEVARRAGVTKKAIRFYETAGVLPPPARGANGYRLYAPDAVEMLKFVTQAAGLGLTLAEIREIVAIRQGGRPPCVHVRRLLEDKARELDRKLQDLLEMRRQVRRSLAAWRRAPAGKAAVCPHIESRSVDGQRRVVATRERRRPYATA